MIFSKAPSGLKTSRLHPILFSHFSSIQQIIDTARMVDGFLYYIYADPSRNMTPALKLSYVANVDNTWLLGSGIYAKGEEAN